MKQKGKRQKFRARHKSSKAAAWMLEEQQKRRWREKKEKFDKDRELEIEEAEILANKRREEHALALEEKARQLRSKSDDAMSIDADYINICTNIEESDAGTLNLSSCQTTCSTGTISNDVLQKAAYYRDLAEEMKRDNRRLRGEMSEKVDIVRKFW